MAEPDDSQLIPTEIGLPRPEGEVHPPEPLSDSAIENLLGPARTPPSGGGTRRAWTPPSVEELQAGFAQYEVVAMIGRGGMGAVFKGWQKSLDRFVAIKILPPAFEDDPVDFAARFQREGKAMARFKHPGIVAVYDAGQTADGLLYFVMEYVEGTDVGQMLSAQGRLPAADALAIATHVCAALDYAHGHGVIHRDIKPSNVLLDSDGTVKVADFGLARITSQETATHTRSDISMGTPDYMPPEALTPGVKVDHRADLYALGAMLYQMLTGSPPRGRFAAASACVAGLDPRVDAIVDRALQPDREQRYASAAAFRADLDGLRTTPIPVALPEPARRGKAPLLIAAAFAVLAILAVAIFRHRGDSSPGGPRSVVAQTSSGEGGETVGADGASPSRATKDAPFVNTLGMKFVPVPITGGPTGGQRVLFSVWETRVQDYRAFFAENKREWPKTDFKQDFTHPATNMKWEDARAFCVWLTERERKAGRLGAAESYRLPGDHEWSCAVGIGEREDAAKLPETKTSRIHAVYPWGTQWPPPVGTGNYAGEERQHLLAAEKNPLIGVVTGYRDGFENTAPVGSFAADRLGLHDLSGNVGEYCEDWFNASQTDGVARGGSWQNYDHGPLFSSYRGRTEPASIANNRGFRVVLAGEATGTGKDASVSPSPSPQVSPSSVSATKDAPSSVLTFGGHRYQFVRGTFKWSEAKAKAEELGGHLATLTTREEADWAKQTFLTRVNTVLWLGARLQADGQWAWITGEPWAYTDWARWSDGGGEPGNQGETPPKSKAEYLELLWFPTYVAPGGWDDVHEFGANVPANQCGLLVEWDDAGK